MCDSVPSVVWTNPRFNRLLILVKKRQLYDSSDRFFIQT